ncbi:MAG: cation diffusion facilitator family transporter [Thermoplasmatota archaeon]
MEKENEDKQIKKKLKIALVVNVLLVVIGLIGYIISNSLAILGDTGHVMTDVLAIATSLTAINIAALPAHKGATYGHHRAEVLAALLNSTILLFLAGYIFYESYKRFVSPVVIHSNEMFIIAVIGLVGNLYATYILHGYKDINVRGAYLHLLADTLSSATVVVGAIVIIFTNNYLIDPILSVVIALFIISGSIKLLKESIGIIMQWTPEELNLSDVIDTIKNIEGVEDVHDVHLWSLCSSINTFTAHVLVRYMSLNQTEQIKRRIKETLKEEYHVYHSTLEFECEECGNDTVENVCHPGNEESLHNH